MTSISQILEPTTIDTSQLEIGMIVKNYKELCQLLNEEVKAGDSKVAQLKEWQRYFNFERPKYKQSYIILDIYDEPLEKEDNRKQGNNNIYGNENDPRYQELKKYFQIPNEYINNPGVYKIENDQYVYIGSTTTSFAKRFSQHYHNYSHDHDRTQLILLDNGTFTHLKVFEPGTDEETIRQCEADYINQYKQAAPAGKEVINVNTPYVRCSNKKPKIKYTTIKVPADYLNDIKDCIETYGGYYFKDNIVY